MRVKTHEGITIPVIIIKLVREETKLIFSFCPYFLMLLRGISLPCEICHLTSFTPHSSAFANFHFTMIPIYTNHTHSATFIQTTRLSDIFLSHLSCHNFSSLSTHATHNFKQMDISWLRNLYLFALKTRASFFIEITAWNCYNKTHPVPITSVCIFCSQGFLNLKYSKQCKEIDTNQNQTICIYSLIKFIQETHISCSYFLVFRWQIF